MLKQNPLRSAKLSAFVFTAILVLCLQPDSRADDSDDDEIDAIEKIHVIADQMQLNINSGNSVYTGNVKITQGELELTGDKVTIEQSDENLERMIVTGKPAHYNHVTKTGENIQAESGQMVYTASQNELIMTIDAKLLQPDHRVSSQRIVYDTKNKIVIAGDKSGTPSGNSGESQRVNITLTPKKEPQKP